jgi:hypothetical protein
MQQAAPERAIGPECGGTLNSRAALGHWLVSAGSGIGGKHPCGLLLDALKTPRENNGLEIKMRKVLMGAAAAAMIAGSSVAQAAPVADIRSPAPVAEADEVGGGAGLWIGVLAAILLALALIAINEDDNPDGIPTSP